jgi:hypothetical protein
VGGWSTALLAATAAHAGFQVTVTALVYPALVRVPSGSWAREHARHSRRITPLVGVVYLAVLVTCAGTLLSDPSYGAWVATAGSALALGVTAALAAPLHARLGSDPSPRLMVRLVRVDRLRAAGALVALAGAVLAVL